jgi:ABC-type multidrug transport system ATPase subunit
MILETKALTKKYGKITAVNNLNLSIPKKAVFGILGPNGSGKTTTLGLILDVIEKNGGEFKWNVGEPGNERKKIGAILESPNFYPYLSGYENLNVVATIKGVENSKINPFIKQVGLYDRKNDAFKTYSLGMKQRLAIASALLSDPQVLILDEPTNGLDPKGIVEIRELIKDIAAEGRTIILASHLLDEVQKVCDHFCVLNKGKLIFTGRVDELTRQKNQFILASTDHNLLIEKLNAIDWVSKAELIDDRVEVIIDEDAQIDKLTKQLADEGIYITHLSPVIKSLEKKFIEILSQNE